MYACPMHAEIRRADAGECPRCGMALISEGSRFGLLRHMIGSPRHLAVMIAVMVALMAVAMTLLH